MWPSSFFLIKIGLTFEFKKNKKKLVNRTIYEYLNKAIVLKARYFTAKFKRLF